MAGSVKALILLAFTGSLGMMFMLLACALPRYNNWWPLFVIIFYILAPIPYSMARRYRDDMGASSSCLELAVFFTAGIIISSFGLPIVLAHAPSLQPVIEWGACALVMTGNVVMYLTILGFFLAFDGDADSWNYF
ncbi:leptin receptor overlapping transcript-like 1 [Pollicipes pollicipes]|uniref:leptin receptor overlapping transcript-like 1 n=1 Tax=Pollicipes pollicipes TaxID=41117 RepID=UPI00188584F8|nr:leptin receptor overlapping transcript-like 1 [Pollicipes pollicipes]XP_037077745.1 leptin receptor overlapping transcript-like 1 [Pollicipes pollicipes]